MKFGRLIVTGLVIGLFVSAWLHGTQASDPQPVAAPTPLATSAAAVPAPSSLPSSSPAVAGEASVKLPLYGVKMTVTDPITDLVYGDVRYGGGMAAGFTTESLLAKYPACTAGALGTLVRSKALATPTPSKVPTPTRSSYAAPTPTSQPVSKTVGGFTYTYKSPAFTCATDQAGRNAVAAGRAAVQNGALPTLSN